MKENLDRKKTLETKPVSDESNFHEHFGYTLRCATGRKVRDACILWMDIPYYLSNDANSANLSSFKLCSLQKPSN